MGRQREDAELVTAVVADRPATDGDIRPPPTDRQTFVDTYAAKKSVAQGMMDIALLTANANQLRYLVEYSRQSPTFEVNVVLIITSLVIQIAVGVSLIFKGRADLSTEDKRAYAERINNYVVVGIFVVTVLNVIVAAFSIPAAQPKHWNNNNDPSGYPPVHSPLTAPEQGSPQD